MARSRNIKPGFFKNEDLGTADPFVSLLFAGLWTLADKAGILEDRPLRIKAELFPYRDGFDINGYLTVLVTLGFIHRYEANGMKLIYIDNFSKHQNPHHTEKDTIYPLYTEGCTLTVIAPLNNRPTPADSLLLIPDSLNADSLIPDSQIPSLPAAPKKARTAEKSEEEKELQEACKATWNSYCNAFFNRYGTEPIRNASVNTCIKNFVKRIGYEESPFVAAHFLLNNSSWYVTKGHSVASLLADAEKLRTEWATGKSITATRAKQIDQSEANCSMVGEAMKILEGMENAKNS
jgi:hypothetical protein